MMLADPSPETTLAVVLGASEWPDFPDFQDPSHPSVSEAFTNASHDFREYLLDPQFFGLPQKNLLNLFDTEDEPVKIDRQIRRFLDTRIAVMKESAHAITDLLVYYVGHGGFVGRNSDYYLAARCTSSENPELSGIRMEPFVAMLTQKAGYLRRILILDCCYAGAAYHAFQAAGGPAEVAFNKMITYLENQNTSIGEGASLLCSSGKDAPSLIEADGRYTQFSKAFIEVLKEGDLFHPNLPRLSLSRVATLTEAKLRQEIGERAPRPEVHSPYQEHGIVAKVPIFPNPAMNTDGETTRGASRSLTIGSVLQDGRYIIRNLLGQRGTRRTWLALDKRRDDIHVTLKELVLDNTDPEKLKEDLLNFKLEVRMLAHLDHSLIPKITDNFEEGLHYFMVQENVEGENLEERIDRLHQPMKERDVLECASEVLDTLVYLSYETPPIVHCDIKPANIIIGTKDKRAHLVDFDIARADITRNAKRKQTSVLGTSGYAPPEQYQGNADPRFDLYALAATMHHLLTNRDPRNHPPFVYPPVRALNPQLSPEIERILSRALTNDINHQYQSAAAMKQDVDSLLYKRFGNPGYNSSDNRLFTIREQTTPPR